MNVARWFENYVLLSWRKGRTVVLDVRGGSHYEGI